MQQHFFLCCRSYVKSHRLDPCRGTNHPCIIFAMGSHTHSLTLPLPHPELLRPTIIAWNIHTYVTVPCFPYPKFLNLLTTEASGFWILAVQCKRCLWLCACISLLQLSLSVQHFGRKLWLWSWRGPVLCSSLRTNYPQDCCLHFLTWESCSTSVFLPRIQNATSHVWAQSCGSPLSAACPSSLYVWLMQISGA